VPDANILSVDTHLELMRAIGEVQDAPIIADLDTGYGNAINVAYLVPRYAAAGVAAVVIEDKTFPKDSSLRPGGRQVLVPLEEFQGKIEAARLADGPLVVARTEALIAGLGQAEALRRGAAYAEAGADAVLIHSKEKTPDEILEFSRAWPGEVPLVLVPTSYPQLSFAQIAALGKVGLIICANHAIRAAVAAMRATFSRILDDGGIAGVEGTIATVAEISSLQGDELMRDLETRFLR
jgi:phosphonopyruvate hydrolase